MAVFLINICKFNGCGITFPSLGDLIQHIEDTHIDYDAQIIEQNDESEPVCLPLSYVLRFITDAARKEGPFLGTSGAELKRKLAIKHHSYSMSSSNRSNTPTDIGSEVDEDEMMVSESEDSNDSWTTEEFSSEFIMRYGSRHSGSLGNNASNEKPFACPVPGCKKRYKNVNGIKYHSKNGHKKDGKVRKGFKCHCGKSYKTSQGLKSHSLLAHGNTTSTNSGGAGATGILTDSSFNSSQSQTGGLMSGELSPSSNSGGAISNGSSSIASTVTPPSLVNQCQQLSSTPLKNTFGLISIKSKSPPASSSPPAAVTGTIANSITSVVVSNNNSVQSPSTKLLKLMNDVAAETKLIDASTGVKMNLPSLVNLGILTPATSPKQQQQQHQQQQQQQLIHQQQINQSNIISNNNHNSINGGGVSVNNNSNNCSDSLPLTPISPNMSRNINFNNNNNNINNNNNNATTNLTGMMVTGQTLGSVSGGSITDSITTDET